MFYWLAVGPTCGPAAPTKNIESISLERPVMTFAIKANLSFTTAEVPTQPVKPKTDVPSTPVNTEQPAANPVNKEQQPAATAIIDPAAAEKKAIETIQNLASQYGIKTGNLSTEEGRAKAVTDMWVKINNNVEKARLSKDPADHQAANTAKTAFLDQLKDARGAGWNFGLRELVQSASPKVSPDASSTPKSTPPVVPTNPNPQANEKPAGEVKPEKSRVQSNTPVAPTSLESLSQEAQVLVEDIKKLNQDRFAFSKAADREGKMTAGGNGDATVRARLIERATDLLARYDSIVPRGEALLKGELKGNEQLEKAIAAIKADYPKMTEYLQNQIRLQNVPQPASQITQ
jgi:hypothetical protein